MEMQKIVGQLCEAVASLKEQSRTNTDKLEKIGRDVHAAKVVISIVGSLIVLAAGVIGWTINTLLQYLTAHPPK